MPDSQYIDVRLEAITVVSGSTEQTTDEDAHGNSVGQPDRAPEGPPRSAHERAVANTVEWADQAASEGSYDEALAWLEMIERIDGPLPESCEARRSQWLSALGAAR